jgi:ketosteroid isomerase-like protein
MRSKDEAAIRELIKARNAAVYEGDAKRAVAPLAMDVVAYDLQPPLQIAGAAARDADAIAAWLATWDGPVEVEMRDPVVAADGDLAFAHGLSRMYGTKKEFGTGALWFRTTLCLRRIAGAWSVVHEHNSVPMKMDGSGLAATDLQPDTNSDNA